MSDIKDVLGTRMKVYEGVEAQRRLMPGLPAMIRLDGRSFHTFTKGLIRPFDPGLMGLMQNVTELLVKESNARIGYTQSDEISLVLYSDSFESQLYFDGRIQKITSSLAAFASVHFNLLMPKYLPNKKVGRAPTFDCRVWNVPDLEEAANCIMWREWDATKNSVSMAAQAVCSHKELHGLNGLEQKQMLLQRGIDWDKYPPQCKRGTFIRRTTTTAPFTAEDLEALPPGHNARKNPGLSVTRSKIEPIVYPPLATVANRVKALFFGGTAYTEEEFNTMMGPMP